MRSTSSGASGNHTSVGPGSMPASRDVDEEELSEEDEELQADEEDEDRNDGRSSQKQPKKRKGSAFIDDAAEEDDEEDDEVHLLPSRKPYLQYMQSGTLGGSSINECALSYTKS